MGPGAGAATAPLDVDRLRDRVGGCRLARRIEVHESIGSTNERARELGRSGAPDATLVVAEEQTRGRGRRGRAWESPASAGLYCTAVLRPERVDARYAASLQLAAGVAVAETLGPLTPRPPELLWPNDLLCDGAKVAGVLVEGEGSGGGMDFLVCGIGVNVNQSAADFSASLRGRATSLRMLTGRAVDRTGLLARLLLAFESWEDVARRGGPDDVARRWEQLSPTARGHDVEIDTVDGLLTGRSAGLGPGGGLRVETAGGVREVLLGELIRVRRKT